MLSEKTRVHAFEIASTGVHRSRNLHRFPKTSGRFSSTVSSKVHSPDFDLRARELDRLLDQRFIQRAERRVLQKHDVNVSPGTQTKHTSLGVLYELVS